jgi:hypothetical protein
VTRAVLPVLFALACGGNKDAERDGPPDLASAERSPEVELAAGVPEGEHHATVALDRAGVMLGAWRTETSDGDIYTRRFSPDFDPEAAELAAVGSSGWTDYPDVIADGDRFLLSHAEGNALYIRDSTDGGRFWGAGISVFQRETDRGFARWADLARSDDGSGGSHVVVTWLATEALTETAGFYQFRWFDDALELAFDQGRPVTLSASGPSSNPADVVGLPDGRFATVYSQTGTIWLQFLAAGDVDGEPIDVLDGVTVTDPSRPMLAASPAGDLVVGWHSRDDATRDLSAAAVRFLAPDGSANTGVVPLGKNNALATRPAAEFLSDDYVLLVYSEATDASFDAEDSYAEVWASDGSWSGDRERINTRTAGRQKRTALSVSDAGAKTVDIGFVWETVPPDGSLSVRATRWTLAL